jgi:hypothetical protein
VRQDCPLILIYINLLSRCGLQYRRGLKRPHGNAPASTSSVKSQAAYSSGPLSSRRESSSSDASNISLACGFQGTGSATPTSGVFLPDGGGELGGELDSTSNPQGYEMVALPIVDGQGSVNTGYDYEV